MDLKTSKRNIIGILIITIIFAALSIISIFRMSSNRDEEEKLQKKDYVLMLEKELDRKLAGENDFEYISNVGYEVIVEPIKYKNYYKPCFDFEITEDAIIIKNRLAKEFSSFGFREGMKIEKINGTPILGKEYFEVFDLIYSKKENEVKEFTLSDGTKINYQYRNYNNKLSYDEEGNILYLYNLDQITVKAIHEVVLLHPDLTLDLTYATVNTLEGVTNFVSLFSKKGEVLFKTPENIIGQDNRKINELKIVINDNRDKGILYALTTIKTINKNITIDYEALYTTKFYASKKLESSNFTIYIKNVSLESKSSSDSGSVVV